MENKAPKAIRKQTALLVVFLLVIQMIFSGIPNIYGTGGGYPDEAAEYNQNGESDAVPPEIADEDKEPEAEGDDNDREPEIDTEGKDEDSDTDTEGQDNDTDTDTDGKNGDSDADTEGKDDDSDADADADGKDGDSDADTKGEDGDSDADTEGEDGDSDTDTESKDGDSDADTETEDKGVEPDTEGNNGDTDTDIEDKDEELVTDSEGKDGDTDTESKDGEATTEGKGEDEIIGDQDKTELSQDAKENVANPNITVPLPEISPSGAAVNNNSTDRYMPFNNDVDTILSLSDYVSILSVTLYDKDGNPLLDFDPPASISFNDILKLRIEFELGHSDNTPNGQVAAIWDNIKRGIDTYELPLPPELVWEAGPLAEKPIYLTTSDNLQAKIFAELFVNDEGIAYLRFTGEYWEQFEGITDETNTGHPKWHIISNAYIELSCKLDKIIVGGGEEEITFEILDSLIITVHVTDNEKTSHYLEKKGEFVDGFIYWEIIYTPGTVKTAFPIKLEDTIDSTQTFVKDSMEIYIGGVKLENPQYDIMENPDGTTTITFTIYETDIANYTPTPPDDGNDGSDTDTDNNSDNITIKLLYKTAIDNELLRNTDEDITVGNTAKLLDTNGGVLAGAYSEVTVDGEDKLWLIKSGDSLANGVIEWSLKINTLSRELAKLVLYDILPNGLTLMPGSISINGTSLAAFGTKLITDQADELLSGKGATFALQFAAPYDVSEMTVKYQTEVSPDYYERFTKEHYNEDIEGFEFNNKAWLEFDWRDYQGTPGGEYHYKSPTVEKNVTVITNIIQKKALRYNTSDHTIEWAVTINPFGVNVLRGTITDVLLYETVKDNNNQTRDIRKHSFIEGTFVCDDSRVEYVSGSYSDISRSFTVSIGAIGKSTVSFTFKTAVDNPDDYAYNTEAKEYWNQVTFDGYVLTKESELEHEVQTVKASAKAKVSSNVIEKESKGYDYAENKIKWQVTVNKNKMPMENVIVTDTVKYGLYFADGEALGLIVSKQDASGNLTALSSPADYTYELKDVITDGDESSQNNKYSALTINLGDIDSTIIISYVTCVDVDNVSGFLNNDKEITFSNNVVLKRDDYDEESDSAEQKITNTILQKNGEYIRSDNKIHYSVNINPYRLLLTDKTIITDKLSEGLALDPGSIKLTEAVIDPVTGGFLKETGKVYTLEDNELSEFFNYDPKKNEFTLELPVGKTAFVLEYDAYIRLDILNNNEIFTNEISITGVTIKDGEGSFVYEYTAIGTGGATSGTVAMLEILKEDSERKGYMLDGITFELRDKYGVLIGRQTTANGGRAVFFPILPGREYTLTEITEGNTGRAGYSPLSLNAVTAEGVITVKKVQPGSLTLTIARSGIITLPITNDPALGSFSFTKVSDINIKNKYEPITQKLLDEMDKDLKVDINLDYLKFTITDTTSGYDYPSSKPNTYVGSFDKTTGVVTFANIPFGTYNVVETYGIAFHTGKSPFTVTISPDGTVTFASITQDQTLDGEPYVVINRYCRPYLEITKKDSDSGAPMDKITFTLYLLDKNNNRIENLKIEKATGSDGKVKFDDLLGGKKYELVETTPDGYYASRVYTTGIINVPTKIEYTWPNYPHAASLQITKYDAYTIETGNDRNGVKLQGAVFELYAADKTTQIGASQTTDRDGVAIFSNLPMTHKKDDTGKLLYKTDGSPELDTTIFWLKETQAPEGYVLPENENDRWTKITLQPTEAGAANPRTFTYKRNISNTPEAYKTTSLRFRKITDDPYNEADPKILTNVQFMLNDKTSGSTLKLGPKSPDQNGIVEFTDIPLGIYELVEVAPPSYHQPMAPITVVFDHEGKLVQFGGMSDANGITGDTLDNLGVENKILKSKLEIIKSGVKAEDIENISFILYRILANSERERIEGPLKMTNGKVAFTKELIGGQTYVVVETNSETGISKDGYYVSGEYKVGPVASSHIGSNNTITVNWTNYAYEASIVITKKDSQRPDMPASYLAGAVFELYPDDGTGKAPDKTKLIDTQPTGPDGKATFTNLPLKQSTTNLTINSEPVLLDTIYWLVEATAPPGYTLNNEPHKITLKGGTGTTIRTQTQTGDITDIPVSASFSFTKYSDSIGAAGSENRTLEGAEFTLSSLDNWNYKDKTSISNATGVVYFGNIPFGHYVMKETKIPAYHDAFSDVYVTITKDGKVIMPDNPGSLSPLDRKINEGEVVHNLLTVIDKVWRPSLKITKTDDAGNPISGVSFLLEHKLDADNWNIIAQYKTNQDGEVVFAGEQALIAGDAYRVTEIEAPDGYYVPASPYEFVATEQDEHIFVWINHPYKGSIEITKTDSIRGYLLNGVEFELLVLNDGKTEEDEDDGNKYKKLRTGFTENGILRFNDLDLNLGRITAGNGDNTLYGNLQLESKTYYVREVDSHDPGYRLNNPATVYLVRLTQDNQNVQMEIENAPVTGSFGFYKVNQWGRLLNGAVFRLTDETPGSSYSQEATSGVDGKVTFTDVPFGKYNLVEITAPVDHGAFGGSKTYGITISRDGGVAFDGDFVIDYSNAYDEDMSYMVVNEFYAASVKIIKRDAQTRTPLAGVGFAIYDSTGIERGRGRTGTNGELTFRGLMINETYNVTETEPLPGYYPASAYAITPTEDGKTYEIEWLNFRPHGTVTLTKADFIRNGIRLEGVEFAIYYDDGSNEPLDVQKTDADGRLTFTVPIKYAAPADSQNPPEFVETRYIIKELNTVTGYIPDETPRFVTLTASDHKYDLGVITNQPRTGGFSFIKTNSWGRRLEGAVFILTDQTPGSGFARTAVSGDDGTVIFTGLPFGVYTLIEITSPEFHYPDYTGYTFEIDKEGRLSYINLPVSDDGSYVIYNEFLKGAVSVLKLDISTNEPMEGIEFAIYDSEGELRGTAVTDESGAALFTDLMLNETYTINETTPNGYYPWDPVAVEVTEAAVHEIVWFNYPYDASITITKTSSASSYTLLSGVKFGLYAADEPDVLMAEGVTDANGILAFSGLPLKVLAPATRDTEPVFGETVYIIKELATIPGYYLLEEPVTVSLTNEEQHKSIYVANRPIPPNPTPTPTPTPSPETEEPEPTETQTPSATPSESPSPSVSPSPSASPSVSPSPTVSPSPSPTPTESTETPETPGPSETPAEPTDIPDINEVTEEDIIHSPQLPDGYGIVQVGDDTFVIYDDDGIPLGYIILPDDVPLDEFDIIGNMIPLGKVNPQTGNWAEIASQWLWQWLILPLLAVIGFIAAGKTQKKKNRLANEE